MADINQAAWSETDASNNSTPPNGFPENSLPSTVDDWGRATMGAIRRWYDRINATVTSGGTANAQTLTYTVAPTALVAGDIFSFIVGAALTNTGATTLNINALGAIAVQRNGAALVGGELKAGALVHVCYDGTVFRILATDGDGAWASYTPTVTAGSGTFTSVSATGRYRQIGKTVFWQATITDTTNGTAASWITLGLPVTVGAGNYAVSGRENGISGKMVVGQILAAGTVVTLYFYDGSYPGATGAVIFVSGVYEAA